MGKREEFHEAAVAEEDEADDEVKEDHEDGAFFEGAEGEEESGKEPEAPIFDF